MNFALILFILLLVSGAIWATDTLIFRKRRAPEAKDPWWVEYGASFFPVILVVFILRSFIFEPFKIPSGSMIPTLLVGDFILVNKYTYGIRLPVINKKIIDVGNPQRGDVMVFRYPEDPSLDYIKQASDDQRRAAGNQQCRGFSASRAPLLLEAIYREARRGRAPLAQ